MALKLSLGWKAPVQEDGCKIFENGSEWYRLPK
jgi:hypothetical protein